MPGYYTYEIKLESIILAFLRRETINRNLWRMTLDQRLAFGLWYSKALTPSDIARSPPSLIRDAGNLIAYLPFNNFQHLSPAQVTPGWETWGSQDWAEHSGTCHNTDLKKALTVYSFSVIADEFSYVSYVCISIGKVGSSSIKNDLKIKELIFQCPAMDFRGFKGISLTFQEILPALLHV